MADRTPARRLRDAVVWAALDSALEERAAGGTLHVVDTGGGTGGFAVPVAELGHRVTVVDPSPDALAALERRAAEAGVSDRVRPVQGDASGLREVVADRADVVLCHGVLEYVDDPAAALSEVAAVLRPGGLASVVVAQRAGAVLARALAGRFDEARHALTDPDGRWGSADPVPRRFTQHQLTALLDEAGLASRRASGVRMFRDLVPGALVDLEPGAAEALHALEVAVAEDAAFLGLAARLHVLAENVGR